MPDMRHINEKNIRDNILTHLLKNVLPYHQAFTYTQGLELVQRISRDREIEPFYGNFMQMLQEKSFLEVVTFRDYLEFYKLTDLGVKFLNRHKTELAYTFETNLSETDLLRNYLITEARRYRLSKQQHKRSQAGPTLCAAIPIRQTVINVFSTDPEQNTGYGVDVIAADPSTDSYADLIKINHEFAHSGGLEVRTSRTTFKVIEVHFHVLGRNDLLRKQFEINRFHDRYRLNKRTRSRVFLHEISLPDRDRVKARSYIKSFGRVVSFRT